MDDDNDNVLSFPVGNLEVPINRWQVVSEALKDVHTILSQHGEMIQMFREIMQEQIKLNAELIIRIKELEGRTMEPIDFNSDS
jgi:hypothetical protein